MHSRLSLPESGDVVCCYKVPAGYNPSHDKILLSFDRLGARP